MNKDKNIHDIYGVILAGGSGSRLWPLSRESRPKQLLNLTGDNSLFQETFLRLSKLIPQKNIITVTNNLHLSEIKVQLDEIANPAESIAIGEPAGRNTAPAITLAALFIKNSLAEQDSDPVVIVTPSDHLVQNEEAFLNAVTEGAKLAEDGFIVTFGIKPSCPETGYGYIKVNENSNKVDEFKEKPDFETAQKYLESGNYFWNSGIFMFKISTLLEEIRIYSPEVFEGVKKSLRTPAHAMPANRHALAEDFVEKEAYQAVPSISIDYAVMEKSDKIALVPVDCGWSDLGSWEAVHDAMKKDAHNNFTKGNVIALDTENSCIYSSSRLVVAIGLKNIVIIETEDAILVCDKSRTQDVKMLSELSKTV